MIKSSDPLFANTYRILRVLSNQDYLATDHSGRTYIFSQTKYALDPPAAHPHSHHYLLRHREVISIDQIRYAVFEVVGSEVVWAPIVKAKRMEGESFVERLIKHSCQHLLKQLIWMGCNQAKKYLDLKNMWLIDDQLHLLLVPRFNQVKFTIKKCEKRSLSNEKSIDLIMEGEKMLMKEFTLLLWQVCFQCPFEQDNCLTSHPRSKQLLRMMLAKAITYEELLNELNKQTIASVYTKKPRLKTFAHQEILARRKTLSSFEKSKSSLRELKASRTLQANTESIARPKETIKKQTAQRKETPIIHSSQVYQQTRSFSVEDTSKQNHLRKPRYLYKHTTRNSSNDDLHYDKWLQNKKYSIQIRQKLFRNGELARKKFSQVIEATRKESSNSKSEKFDDTGFKEKILSKVIKFKNSIKARQSFIQQTEPAHNSQNDKQARTLQNSRQNDHPITIDYTTEKVTLETNDNQLNFQQQALPKNEVETKRQQTPKLTNGTIQSEEGRKIDNEYIYSRPKQQTLNNTLKTEKKKLNKIDVFTSNHAEADEDLQEVKLPSAKITKLPQKKPIILAAEPPPPQPASSMKQSRQECKTLNAEQAIGELMMLINTLGDITVRAVKCKDKLTDINWRQATYFMYERFLFERTKLADILGKEQLICRQHRKIEPQDWKKYCSGKRKETLKQITDENEQIAVTLNRLGQKLLQEETLQRKIEYFVRNREKIEASKDSKLRSQLSKFLISSIISEYDFAWEQELKSPEIIHFFIDAYFALYVIAELDGILPQGSFIRLDEYKEYDKTLNSLKPFIDYIDSIYFPKDENQEAA